MTSHGLYSSRLLLAAVVGGGLLVVPTASAQRGDAAFAAGASSVRVSAPLEASPTATFYIPAIGETPGTGSDPSASTAWLNQPFTRDWQLSRISTSVAYAYSPAVANYVRRQDGAGWNQSFEGATLICLTNSKTTAIQMSGHLEVLGPIEGPHALAQAAGQELTLEWGVSRLFSFGGQSEHSSVIELNAYDQRLAAQAGVLTGPTQTQFPRYTFSSTGVEATFTVPQRNMSVSFRYGKDGFSQGGPKMAAVAVELSWAW